MCGCVCSRVFLATLLVVLAGGVIITSVFVSVLSTQRHHITSLPFGFVPWCLSGVGVVVGGGTGAGAGVSSSLCFGVDVNGDPCTCARSCLFPGSTSPCSLPQSQTCFDQSPVTEYEYLPLYQQNNNKHKQQTFTNAHTATGNQPIRAIQAIYSTIDPPSSYKDGNCAMTFRNVQLIDGNRLVIFANDTYIDKQFSLHSNAVLVFNKVAVSTVGNPNMNRYAVPVVRETTASYAQHQTRCTQTHAQPVFLMGSRDHTLGNFYHFHSELWHQAFFTLANPSRDALRPLWEETTKTPVANTNTKCSACASASAPASASLAWMSSNATVLHYAGSHSYEHFAVKVADFTDQRPMQPILTHQNNRQGVECFSQITLGLENTMHLYQTVHIRRQVQPLIDWADWRYNVSLPYTGRITGWKVFRDALIAGPSNPDPRPHVVISTRKYPGRFLHNMSLVISVFERHGFRVSTVLFTPIPIKQTIELVRTAHVFMQVHGAGLSNSLFVHAGCTVIQLLNPIHPLHKPPFPRLAWNVGAKYLEMPIMELKDTSVLINDWKAFEELVSVARSNVAKLLSPEATWSPTRPSLFQWPIAPMLPQCGIPEVHYHNEK